MNSQMEQLIKQQHNREKELKDFLDGEQYTLENPKLILNPYGHCPLSGLVLFILDKACELTIDVEGEIGSYQLTKGKYMLPLLGFKPNKKNVVILNVIYKQEGEVSYKAYDCYVDVPPLPEDYPNYEIKINDKKRCAKGYYALSLGKSEGVKTTHPLYSMIDQEGDVRWLYTQMTCHVFKQLKNGNIIVDAPVSSGICGAYTASGFVEMDLVGRFINYMNIPNGLHHDVCELPSGNFLAITQRENTKQDLLVEIDRTTTQIIKEWDFRQILDPTRLTVIDKISVNHPLDWLHMNAVVYDEKDHSIIISSRNQSCVVKINKDTSEIKWIIAPLEGWNEKLKRYVLKPKSIKDISWAPHTPIIEEDGTLLLFDNGNFRSYDLKNAKLAYENYSRGIAYKIDETLMTYEHIWDYGEKRGNKLYCPYLGAIRSLENGNRLMCFGGITKDVFGGPTDDMKSNRMKNQVVVIEVTKAMPAEVVFEMSIKDTNIQTAEGYKCYRCEKMYLYKREYKEHTDKEWLYEEILENVNSSNGDECSISRMY